MKRWDIPGFDALAELALDMRWSWNNAADSVWQQLDPELWSSTNNPWVVLQTISLDRLQQMAADKEFREKVEKLVLAKQETAQAPAWFQKNHAGSPLTAVAYFSMEFMLSEALPIYAGGLGNVAGDQLKAASDLGVPVVGVGLLYQQGYFRQVIGWNGEQQALYPYNDPSQLPVTPLRLPNGEWLRVEVELPGSSVLLRAWQVQVGRVKLYLLDSNDASNYPPHRGITSELYGGGPELRLKQELVLGVGGWRLLRALGIKPQVCHLNEGHAAFAVLERARCFMEETGQPFDAALAATRAGNLFTTHTAVAAGFDRFDPGLVEYYFSPYAKPLGLPVRQIMALGRQDPNNNSEPFNMAYLAIRGSGAVNGVSRLHGQVSRHIFTSLFPRWPEAEIPVGHITNGIHVPSWNSAAADTVWANACGKDRWLGSLDTLEQDIRRVSDKQLWQLRNTSRSSLIGYARERLAREMAQRGGSPEAVESIRQLFDPGVLTIGFARRFATYKRPNLLLHDPERLRRILTNARQPVQLIIAGKAHPADMAGQILIQEWIRFIEQSDVRSHVVFLADYDMSLTQRLVQGVDVWLNTPRRPWEASGTSGMKVLVNGALNVSELDGWWVEAYTPQVGWALGDGKEHGDDPGWDAAEANTLYDMLEREIIPEFYTRDADGIPGDWIARMRESMARLTPQYSANRTVREYTEKCYLPAASACQERTANGGALGVKLANERKTLDDKWPGMRFGGMKIESSDTRHQFEVPLFLGEVDPNAVRVELFADAVDGQGPVRQELVRGKHLPDAANGYVYSGSVANNRPAADYTARAIPHLPGLAVPLETAAILWQR